MATYLIDYENTKNLAGIGSLSESDRVIIFYSKNANTITFDAHKELSSSKAKIEYKYVAVGGRNALDFQLSSYLGYLLKSGENSKEEFHIISKDNGFDYVINFWKAEKNINVELYTNLEGNTQHKEREEKNSTIETALKQSPLKLKDNEIKKVIEIVSQYKTKQAINSNMSRYFRDNAKVSAITKELKPFIKDKK